MAPNPLCKLPPFFEPGAPPPTLPIILAQTELGMVQPPGQLLAQQQLGSGVPNHRVRFSPYPKPALKKPQPQRARSATPSQGRRRSYSREPTSDEDSDEQLESGIGDSSDDDDDDDDNLIQKPEGEAGRPGRGGYNLEAALGWDKKEYRKLKNYVKRLIDEYLDPSKSFSSQPLSSINTVRRLATEKFTLLRDYSGSWPAVDLMRLQLKYKSQRARLQELQVAAEIGKRKSLRI